MDICSFDIKYNNNGFWIKTIEIKGVHYLASLDKDFKIKSLEKKVAWDAHGRGGSPRTGLNSFSEFKEKEDVTFFIKNWLKKNELKIKKCLDIIQKEGFKKPEAFKNGIFLLKAPVKFYYDKRFFDIFNNR